MMRNNGGGVNASTAEGQDTSSNKLPSRRWTNMKW